MVKYFSTRVINIRKLAWIIFKDAGRTPQETPSVSIMKNNQLTFICDTGGGDDRPLL